MRGIIRTHVRRVLTGLVLVLCAGSAAATVIPSRSIFVAPRNVVANTGGNPIYDTASLEVFVDPAVTTWIAWNNRSDVAIPRTGCDFGFCLGAGAFGTDDFIRLTITPPGGGTALTVDIDRNDAVGNDFGIQNVIFGDASTAPDALRIANPFSFPTEVIFDDSGSHNAVFTAAGTYNFDFEFRNNSNFGPAGHGLICLLIQDTSGPGGEPGPDCALSSAVPEPGTLALAGLGLAGLGMRRRAGVA